MKKIVVIILAIAMLIVLTACGSSRSIKYAYISLPNGKVKEIEVSGYVMGSSSVRITANDGTRYVVSIHNCLMTTDRLDWYESAR